MKARIGPAYILLVLAILATAVVLRFADPFFIAQIRLIGFDSYQRLGPASYDPNLPVRIVDIDEESLARISQWPWPRTVMATLLTRLRDAGAASVAFDVIFAQPDQSSPEAVVAQLPAEMAEALRDLSSEEPSHDATFAEAIAAAPTVLGLILTNRVTPDEIPVKAGFVVAGDDPRPWVRAFLGETSNLDVLDEAATGIGSVNWVPDRDQIIRRIPLIFRVGEEFVPSLVMESLRVVQGASTYVLRASNASGQNAFGQSTGLNAIRVGQFQVPTDADGGIWLRFRESDPRSYIPAWQVISGEADPNEIAGMILLVGTSAPGLTDIRATPLQAAVPGVEIHAQAIEHILAGEPIVRPDYALPLELAGTILVGIVLAFAFPTLPVALAGLATLTALIAPPIAGWLAYDRAGLLLDATFPVLALILLASGTALYVYRNVERQRGEIRRAFGHYVSPLVVDELIHNPKKLVLGGEIRELTVLFSDVRNFTSISERMSATELTSFINGLLTPLSQIILGERGTIDKYMGDAVMAFWNAPLDEPEHPERALRAALAMIADMRRLNAEWKTTFATDGQEFTDVRIGIGINTGDCCVGNLGSVLRFDYSAIGDEVNVASRLEGLCKYYGVPIVVHEATLKRVPDLAALELDMVRVKGRGHPSRILTLVDALGVTGDGVALRERHGAFLTSYRGRDWDGAEAAIADCEAYGLADLEHLYALYRERIAEWRLDPPPADWDGSHTATTK